MEHRDPEEPDAREREPSPDLAEAVVDDERDEEREPRDRADPHDRGNVPAGKDTFIISPPRIR